VSTSKIERPRGTHDVLPAEQPQWRRVTSEIERLCALYGYHAVTTPVFEDTALFERTSGLADGIYTFTTSLPVPDGRADEVAADLHRIGGRFRWYGSAAGWVARVLVGRLAGERLHRRRAPVVAPGALVDWWTVERAEPNVLVLQGAGWFPGEAWLGYRVEGDRLDQVAALRPKGIPGFLYWKLLVPIHHIAFAQMARRRVR